MVKWLAQEGDLFHQKDGPELSLLCISDSKGREHMLKGEISLNSMSDRPLANLILSFVVASLWKTTSDPFSSDIFMLKIFSVWTAWLFHEQKGALPGPPPPRGAPASLSIGIHSEPPIAGGDTEGCRHGLSWTLCPRGHVPIRLKSSPKGEDYLSSVNAALKKKKQQHKTTPHKCFMASLCEASAGTFSCEGVYICGTLLNICCGFQTAAMLKLWG